MSTERHGVCVLEFDAAKQQLVTRATGDVAVSAMAAGTWAVAPGSVGALAALVHRWRHSPRAHVASRVCWHAGSDRIGRGLRSDLLH